MKFNSAAMLLCFSVVVMMLNRFGNMMGRYNLASQLAQLGMISILLFKKLLALV